MKETLRQKFERLFQDIYINIDPHASTWKKLKITADFLWEKYRYDIELIDYIQYRFYYKNSIDFLVSFYNYREPPIYPCL